MVITNKVDLSDYGITDQILKIRDPAKGSLTLKKEDAKTGEKLAGATFRVEYTLFRNWDEKESFTDETLAACSWITAANPTAATDANGTVTVAGLEPGIYKITEVTPPNGYKADPTPRYVVVTGGMRKTVTLNGKTLAEIPETFRNYSLAAQTQTSRGNPAHPEAAGPIKQIADHRRLCYTGNGLFPSGNHKQIRTKNDVLSNKTTYFPA